MEHDEWVKA
ncbi:host specificity protein J, partial [Escherichia coli EC1848]